MKKISKTLLISFCFLMCLTRTQSQTTQPLNQVELLKQFAGTWKCELGRDTFLISVNTPFGTGMVSTSQIITKGKNILDSIQQLYGYDKKTDRFISAELIKSKPVIEIFTIRFTSEHSGEVVITNPENAPLTFKFEFTAPGILVQTALINGKEVKEITGKRVK
jgi:hypothetical protein